MAQSLNQEIKSEINTDSENPGFINRRRHVRVYYPAGCPPIFLPELIVNHRNCQVLDLSEGGIRFAVSNAAFVKNGKVKALLRFLDGDELEVSGVVVRRDRNQIALMLEAGIPYCRIMSEQLRLRSLEINGLI